MYIKTQVKLPEGFNNNPIEVTVKTLYDSCQMGKKIAFYKVVDFSPQIALNSSVWFHIPFFPMVKLMILIPPEEKKR